MFLEKRKAGKNVKYYLVHSYRDENNTVKKIRRFLGSNLSEKDLDKLRKRAQILIKQQIEDMKTEMFNFFLSKKEIESLNKYNNKIEIIHLENTQWELFTEEFVYNTNAIEGSQVLEENVHEILTKKKATTPDEIETKGVAKAVKYIRNTKEDLSLNLMLKLHKLCFEGSKEFAGKFRDVEVVIRDKLGKIIHQGTLVKNLDYELNKFIKWYKNNKNKFEPLILAAIVHNQFEEIHPFQDGNGRVGRLLLNFILLKNDYPPINILLKDRTEYYQVLQEYQQNEDLKPTLKFLIKEYRKNQKILRIPKNSK